jgi:D-alanyl-D-alanine carboxypeptidase
MMTLYLVFDALDSGRLTLDQRLTVSPHAARQPATNLGVHAGDTITVRQAILALVTQSANDVAVVVAENMAPSEPAFAEMMTEKARKLGMTRTTYRNASGLPNLEQKTTARDMATLALALIKNHPDQYCYFSTTVFEYQGNRYRNHNNLLGTYEGIDGIKTGFINASGFNLVASVVRQGRRLIGVVFGGQTGRARDSRMVALLNQGFRTDGGNGQLMAAAASTRAVRTPALVVAPPKAVAVSSKAKKKSQLALAETKKAKYSSPKPSIASKVAEIVDDVNPVSTAKAAPAPTIATTAAVDMWGIQVGAYAKPDPAREIAERAVAQAKHQLSDGVVKVTSLQMGNGHHLYRARVLGVSRNEAYEACQVLERKKMKCMEIHVTDSLQLASTGK